MGAASTYGEQEITVRGVVEEVDRDIFTNKLYVVIVGGGLFDFRGIQCYVSASDEAALASLVSGSEIEVTGRYSQFILHVELEPCRVS